MRINPSHSSDERRTHRRVGCRLQVMNDSLGVISDISEGGVRFSFHHAISLHDDLDIPIKIENRIIWTRVRPRWVKPAMAPLAMEVGGSFTQISEEDREAIRLYVEKQMVKSSGSGFMGRLGF